MFAWINYSLKLLLVLWQEFFFVDIGLVYVKFFHSTV